MAIDSLASANLAMMKVWAADRAGLSDKQKDGFEAAITSPVAPEAIAYFVEFVFANQGDFCKESRDVAAEVTDFAAAHRFYGLGDDARGNKIAASLRGKPAKDDPEPLNRFTFERGAPSDD